MHRRQFVQTLLAGAVGSAVVLPIPASSRGIRLSVRRDDPGYCGDILPIATVYLDGAELPSCFTADERTGEAWCYAKDAEGKYIIDGDHIREKYVRGNIRIVLRPYP